MTRAIGIVSAPRPAGTSAFAGLVEVMDQEAHGLLEFSGVLAAQRGAVSQGDRPALDATTEDIDRLMLRLTKLREQRQSMVDRLAGGTGASLAELFSGFGVIVPDALRQAHIRLSHAAEEA
ncbi:MAG: flagellar export chaperone FlgN, partial [bacterium]